MSSHLPVCLYQKGLPLSSWTFLKIYIVNISPDVNTYSCGSKIQTAAFGIITLYSKLWLMAYTNIFSQDLSNNYRLFAYK